MHPNIRKIFISGHSSVIKCVGETAKEAIKEKGVDPVIMPFPASGEPPANLSLEKLSDCDAVVLLIGNVYGALQSTTDISIVEMEYDKAKELELDIFVFLIGKELPSNEDKADQDRLEQFIGKIRAENTYCLDNAPLTNLKQNIASAIEQASRYRAFVGPQVFYRSRLAETGSVFSLERTRFLDRKVELDALSKFYANGKKLLFLIGPAGSGKSNLVYEFSQSLGEDWIGFWNGLESGSDALSDIRSDTWKKCLVVIECETSTNLRAVAGLIKNILNTKVPQNGQLKMIVTLRDHMQDECQAIWGELFADEKNREQIILQGLEDDSEGKFRDWIVERVKPVSIDRDHASRIIKRTNGLPLLIRLAINSIKKSGELELASDEQSQDVYFKALLNLLNVENSQEFEKFLRLASLISPYRNDDEILINKVAQFLEIMPSEWIDRSDKACNLGVIKKVGKTLRLYPEPFGDYLVDQACYGQHGTPKRDWVTKILNVFVSAEFEGGVYAQHTAAIIRNLAATESRHKKTNCRRSPIWDVLEKKFDEVDNLAKKQWLKIFRDIAWYNPSWAISFAEKVLDKRKEYPPQQVWGDHFVSGQDLVDDLAAILYPAANHLEHLDHASDLLWEIARQDKRRPNATPEHALRLLENLIEYKEAKSLDYTDKILDRIQSWLDHGELNLAEELSPIPLAAHAFEKQIKQMNWYRDSVSIGTRFINPEGLIPLREKAREIMIGCLKMGHGLLALDAIDALVKDINPPSGIGGVQFTLDLKKAWLPEQLKSIEALEDFIAKDAQFLWKYHVREKLKWSGECHPVMELRNQSKKLCDTITRDPEFEFAEILLSYDFEGCALQRETQARAIVKECSKVDQLISKFQEIFQSLRQFSIERMNGLECLAESIGIIDPNLGLETGGLLLNTKSPQELLRLVNPLISKSRTNNFPRYFSLVKKAVDENIIEVLDHLPWWYWHYADDLQPEEWFIVERLVTLDCTKQNLFTFDALRKLSGRNEQDKQKVKALLLTLPDVGPEESRLADARCKVFATNGGKELAKTDLSSEEVRQFLWKCIPLNDLEGGSYWLGQWFVFVGEKYPDLLVEFFVERVNRLRTLVEGRVNYRAVPFRGGLQQYFGKTNPEIRRKLAEKLFEILSDSQNATDYDARNLIWHILGSDFHTAADLFAEIIRNGDKKSIGKLIYLLQEAPKGFSVDDDSAEFIRDFLGAAKEISDILFRSAISALVLSATSGFVVSHGGKPPQKFVNLIKKCDEALSELRFGQPDYLFYEALRNEGILRSKSLEEDDF